MLDEYMDTIVQSPLFDNLAKEQAEEVLRECIKPTIKKYRKKEIIAVRGDYQSYCLMVLSGKVGIVNERPNGERLLDLAQEGLLYGVISFYSKANYWMSSFEALTDCVVMALPFHFMKGPCIDSCPHHTQIMSNMLTICGQISYRVSLRLFALSIKSLRGRIAYYLMMQHKVSHTDMFAIPMNRNELAEFLNVSRPAMSRELAVMKQQGLIDYYLNIITIKDFTALQDLAGEMPNP